MYQFVEVNEQNHAIPTFHCNITGNNLFILLSIKGVNQNEKDVCQLETLGHVEWKDASSNECAIIEPYRIS